MTKVIEVTDQNFEEEVLGSDVPAEVDFWAPWCGPCVMVSPIYDKLSEEYEDFKFCKINVDENPQTSMKYQIRSIPMQMFFNGGEKVDEILGAVPENVIRSKVEEILNRFPADENGRLKIILGSWIDHNKNHAEKIRKWEEKVKNAGDTATYRHILEAVKKIEEANEQLGKVLIELQNSA